MYVEQTNEALCLMQSRKLALIVFPVKVLWLVTVGPRVDYSVSAYQASQMPPYFSSQTMLIT